MRFEVKTTKPTLASSRFDSIHERGPYALVPRRVIDIELLDFRAPFEGRESRKPGAAQHGTPTIDGDEVRSAPFIGSIVRAEVIELWIEIGCARDIEPVGTERGACDASHGGIVSGRDGSDVNARSFRLV
nr:hypothetical protein [uncultured Enorma sp.]